MSISKRDREAVFVSTEGHSALSGEPLGDSWHIDHRVPRAAGGSDDITNLQPLTKEENLAKSSANPPPLREWQIRFLNQYARSTETNFLLVALPGAGKTIAALMVARDWIQEEPRRHKVLIIVPTDALRTQWQYEAAQLFGLQLQTTEFIGWKSSMIGAITTYQQVNGSVSLWRLYCSQQDILVICDEIHHAADNNDWGTNLREAIGMAKRRLLLSGTPFRSDCTRIPFVHYNTEGRCVAEEPHGFHYDYPDAIRDSVIRVVMFRYDAGVVHKLELSGEELDHRLTSDLDPNDQETNDIHRWLIEPGHYTEELLRQAHNQLLEVRKMMPNAGGLVLCKTQIHAQQIAEQLAKITSLEPDIIVSDDSIATSTVSSFRNSLRPWVVAVRQISEGIDIKRLMVLVYLTTARTLLAFHQAVGRIVRNLGTEHDQQAYCFIPSHPLFVEYARTITTAQDQAIIEDMNEYLEEISKTRERKLFDDVILGTEHIGTEGAVIEGVSLGVIDSERVAALAQELRCSPAIVLRFTQRFPQIMDLRSITTNPQEQRAFTRPLEVQMHEARDALTRQIKRAAFILFPDDDPARFAKVNQLINKRVGKTRTLFNTEDCRSSMVYLNELIRQRR